jgi:hypothetical protein
MDDCGLVLNKLYLSLTIDQPPNDRTAPRTFGRRKPPFRVLRVCGGRVHSMAVAIYLQVGRVQLYILLVLHDGAPRLASYPRCTTEYGG